MMLRRTFDPTLLNEVSNHPEVHPWTGAKGILDLTGHIENPANFALVMEGGGFLLINHEPGIYEVHSLFLPEVRRNTIPAMREGFEYMFVRTDCTKVITQIPDDNKAAAALGKLARFRPMFRQENAPRGPTAFVGLQIEDWMQETAGLSTLGRWFHDATNAELKRSRPDLPDHPDDESHDRVVGACVKMIRAGNAKKATELYNRWARFAGYSAIELISEVPVVLDMSEQGLAFFVEVRDGDMEILKCR